VNRSSWSLLQIKRPPLVSLTGPKKKKKKKNFGQGGEESKIWCVWDLPFGSLTASDVGVCSFCFFSKARGAIGILFSNRLAVWKVLCAVDDDNQSSNFGPVNGAIGKNARRVHCGQRLCPGRHFEGIQIGAKFQVESGSSRCKGERGRGSAD